FWGAAAKMLGKALPGLISMFQKN
uniref:M-poneritoxin-Nc1a n=1 Tax=Neoponera commutata TaxID=613619 RepID=WTX1A_NEOCU|nr:RecName: Full=M-poneritoxin-Nc1a; Short=M-PONTX-Nc1a; AltName: Full=Poneratoxin; AltName: Full=Ponericin Nc1a [Pachycondyla commutata]